MRVLRYLFIPALVFATALPVRAQEQDPIPAPGNRAEAFVAATPEYRFHSDFWMNLHQYLYGIAGGGPEESAGIEAEEPACFAALDDARREAWNAAAAYYRAEIGQLPNRGGLMRAIRYRLNTLGRYAPTDPRVGAVVGRLEAAAPAYRACLWERHDARNRERIGEWVALLVRDAPALQERLSIAYRAGWPHDVVIDVVPYVSYATADTETGPGLADHIMIANAGPDLAGYAALETLLHEPGHIVFGAFHGAIGRALGAAADSLGVRPPRGLWHAVMFHTSGLFVQELAASRGEAYTPYWVAHRLFESYQEPVRRHWQPYLDGEVEMAQAARDLVRAVQME